MFKKSKIIYVIINNSLEYYQIILFGFFSPVIGPLFFPSLDAHLTLITTLAAFATGFLMNPFGGLVFGYLGDRFGRKSTLKISIVLSSLPTFLVGILPSYDVLGFLAPCILIFCRLVQGFSVGGQSYSSVVFVSEQSKKRQMNFACAFLAASSLVGGLIGTSFGALCTLDFMPSWVWRIPFILGGMLGIVGFQLAKRLKETEEFNFAKKSHQLSQNPVVEIWKTHRKNFLCAIAITGATIIPFYMISIYAINTCIPAIFNFSIPQIMLTNTFFIVVWILLLPILGKLADQTNSKLIMKYSALFLLLLSFPLFWIIEISTYLPLTLLSLVFITLLSAGYVAPSGAFLSQLFPVHLRCTGLSFASGIGSALLGGTAPFIGSLIVQQTNSFSSSALYIMIGGLLGFFGVTMAIIDSFSIKIPFLENKNKNRTQCNTVIATLNKQGYMLCDLHEYSQKFVEYAPHADGPVLDIGAGYGAVSIAALKTGAHVIANDIDKRHLEILKQNTPQAYQDRLELRVGKIPTEVSFPENSLGAVLASGVLHFLTGEDLVETIKKVYTWLKPDGKFFIATSTPHTKIFQHFLPIYTQRKQQGYSWPGYIENTADYIPNIADVIPKSMNLLDKDIIESLLLQTGFRVEQMSFFSISKIANDLHSEGNEILGVIASKK